MRKGRFFVLSVMLLLCLELFAAGCGKINSMKFDGEDKKTKILVGEIEKNPAYAPFYAAIEEGYFEQEGLSIKLLDIGDEKEVQKQLISGECHIGLIGSDNIILSDREKAKLMAFALMTARAEPFLVARNPIEKVTSKTISEAEILWSGEEMDEAVFRYILEKNGIVGIDLKFKKMEDSIAAMDSFRNGEGDFILLPGVYAKELERTKDGYSMGLGEKSGNVPYSSFCVGREYWEDHKAILMAYTKALQHGMDFVSKHNEEEIAEKISGFFPKMVREDLINVIKEYKTMELWKEQVLFDQFEFALLQNILMDFEKIPVPILYNEACTDEFSRAAMESADK